MGFFRKLRQFWLNTKRTFAVWMSVYRQVVSIWRMVRSAQQPRTSQAAAPQTRTQATTRGGRTVDVEVIPPRR